MNTVLPARRTLAAAHRASAPSLPRLALMGSGTVGRAFVARYESLRGAGIALPAFAWVGNSRGAYEASPPAVALARLSTLPYAGSVEPGPPDLSAGDILVDATASDAVAERHASWLARGVHVVTANKLGVGASLQRANDVALAARRTGARYGDRATVGAGLPLLRSIRELVAGGDRIHALEGVLSGSLAWLFDRFDGMRPFSGFVRDARAAGYTEPDPRVDLSGEDVRRKLLLLVRAAGIPLESERVEVESLVPAALADAGDGDIDAHLGSLDAPMRRRFQQAHRDRMRLRFLARFEVDAGGAWQASVGLHALPPTHVLCAGRGTDNRVALHSCRYRAQPLVIQGPGAGAEVTAAALLDDVLAIFRAQASSGAGATRAAR